MFGHCLLQPGTQNMGIDLRGPNVTVAEHGLHAAQIGAPLQEMGRKRVPQRMWTQFAVNARLFPV
jgi:hypothetical protein